MQPKLLLTLALLAGLSTACRSTEKLDPNSAEGREAGLRAAQDKAREEMIADIYEQWRFDYVTYRRAVADAMALERVSDTGSGPVRSIDELLREGDPAYFNPTVKSLRDQWVATSQDYNMRLRKLGNDPERDPRSPLRPEVREALVSPPSN
jgi:hypothetical protein